MSTTKALMKKESVIDALVTLANGLEDRSKVAQLREVYPYIEAAKRAGFKNSKIVETLNAQGFELTLKSFEMLLYRIRKAAQECAHKPTPPSPFPQEKGTRQNQSNHLTPPNPSSSAAQQRAVTEGLEGLDKKQRRERLADQFITPELTNPLLKRIKDQQK